MSIDNPELFRRYRLQLFTATWLSYFGFYIVRKVYAVVKLPLKEHFGLDDLQIAWPWTIYLVTYMIGQFLAAGLGRRYESRRILAVGMSVAAVANFVIGLLVDAEPTRAFLWMCVTMGIFGFAQATGWPHNVALFANWTRKSERGTLFAVWGTCYQFGAVFGKGLAGFLLGWLGLAWSFYGSSLVLLAFTVYFVLAARERPESAGLVLHDEAESAPAKSGGGSPGRSEALPRAFLVSVVAMGLIYFGFNFLRYALDSWSALILGEHFGMSVSNAAYSLHRLRLGRFPRRARRRLLVRPHSRVAPGAGHFLDDMRLLPRGDGDVGVRAHFAGPVRAAARPHRLHGDGGGLALVGPSATEAGTQRQAALAAGVINGLGSIGPNVQEPVIGWLKKTQGLVSVSLLLVVIVFLTTVATGFLARSDERRSVSGQRNRVRGPGTRPARGCRTARRTFPTNIDGRASTTPPAASTTSVPGPGSSAGSSIAPKPRSMTRPSPTRSG